MGKDAEKNKVSVTTKGQERSNISEPPFFQNQEIKWLYSGGLDIEKTKLDKILSLPRETLIKDLETVLQDSIDRYSYFYSLIEKQGWDEEKTSFVIHAMCLLGEVKATESIYSIFNALRQSQDYLDFYIGDLITEVIWEPIYKIAAQQLELCKQFIFEQGVDTYAKLVFTDMAAQVVFHNPERREEIIKWYKDVLSFFINCKIEDYVIDGDLIGLIICTVVDIQGEELLPEIESLFDQGYVSITIGGDFNDIKKSFKKDDRISCKQEILSIHDRYREISTTGFSNDSNINTLSDVDGNSEPFITPVKKTSKIGRNDPCPCGSGKKYKKCHGKPGAEPLS